ncbi:H/ACA ribonucleoprotein complex subunit 2-like protein [Humulus lupulus]|uniref:H/ACA ribonucleoprotein complex subunit 2-like protein n=1 Tax=Humulus lupulus TaxID=3486 RepID=UPI002B411047|nr:H/ACA ribonucleoprotein complex subunit 2-like protein [Humulus lupulus]
MVNLDQNAYQLEGKEPDLFQRLFRRPQQVDRQDMVKSLRKNHKLVCVIAGNISPIDVITHVPILCEETEIPYVYVPSKEDLANAGATKRPTCSVLVMTKPAKGELSPKELEKLKSEYDQVKAEVSELAATLF